MFSKSKVKKVDFVTLSKFYGKYKEALQLELINSPAGLSRHICEPALNRPGWRSPASTPTLPTNVSRFSAPRSWPIFKNCRKGMRKSRIRACSGARCRASSSP